MVGGEEVGEVVDRRRPAQHADARAVERQRGGDAHRARDHEALAVVIGDADEREPVGDLAPHGPGGVARQDVDLAVPQRLEARLGGERNEPDAVGVVEHRRSDRVAEIDVEARPLAALVDVGETGQALVDPAEERAARPDRGERLPSSAVGGERRGDRDRRRHERQEPAPRLAHLSSRRASARYELRSRRSEMESCGAPDLGRPTLERRGSATAPYDRGEPDGFARRLNRTACARRCRAGSATPPLRRHGWAYSGPRPQARPSAVSDRLYKARSDLAIFSLRPARSPAPARIPAPGLSRARRTLR